MARSASTRSPAVTFSLSTIVTSIPVSCAAITALWYVPESFEESVMTRISLPSAWSLRNASSKSKGGIWLVVGSVFACVSFSKNSSCVMVTPSKKTSPPKFVRRGRSVTPSASASGFCISHAESRMICTFFIGSSCNGNAAEILIERAKHAVKDGQLLR